MTPAERDAIAAAALAELAAAKHAPGKEPGDGKKTPSAIEEPEVSEPVVLPSPIDEDRLDELLDDDEIAEIKARARREVDKERKKARAKKLYDAALAEARREAGTLPVDEAWAEEMNQPVRVYIDLPRLRKANGGEVDPDPIIIDQRIFQPGRTYEVPMGMAIYLNDLMDKNRRHLAQVDGRSRTVYHQSTGQMIYQGGTASGGPGGPSFAAIHKRSG
jgi:hypothetical protein